MCIAKKLMMLIGSLLLTSQSYAVQNTIEFSADAVISVPQQAVRQTRLFVGKNAVRSESTIDGQDMVEISYPEEGRVILINHHLRAYRDRTVAVKSNKDDDSPCAQIRDAVCERLGTESVNGIKTEKWQIISGTQGRKSRTLHWIDVKRKLAIREFFPDGSVADLKMLKKEKINERDTEKWERTLSRPDGSSIKSYQWYDAGLKIAIREELPGGYVRELKNIKISKQPDKLFNVPQDYKRIDEQSAMQSEHMSR